MDLEEAAMMEPLSVCVNATTRADVTMGDNVIVLGAGPIGLMTLQVARAKGAYSVCVVGNVGLATVTEVLSSFSSSYYHRLVQCFVYGMFLFVEICMCVCVCVCVCVLSLIHI